MNAGISYIIGLKTNKVYFRGSRNLFECSTKVSFNRPTSNKESDHLFKSAECIDNIIILLCVCKRWLWCLGCIIVFWIFFRFFYFATHCLSCLLKLFRICNYLRTIRAPKECKTRFERLIFCVDFKPSVFTTRFINFLRVSRMQFGFSAYHLYLFLFLCMCISFSSLIKCYRSAYLCKRHVRHLNISINGCNSYVHRYATLWYLVKKLRCSCITWYISELLCDWVILSTIKNCSFLESLVQNYNWSSHVIWFMLIF